MNDCQKKENLCLYGMNISASETITVCIKLMALDISTMDIGVVM